METASNKTNNPQEETKSNIQLQAAQVSNINSSTKDEDSDIFIDMMSLVGSILGPSSSTPRNLGVFFL